MKDRGNADYILNENQKSKVKRKTIRPQDRKTARPQDRKTINKTNTVNFR